MFGLLIYGFGFVLVIVAIWLIVEGIESKDKKKVAGGAALGLGAAAGMSYYAKKRKEEKDQQRQLKG